jgi:APA family basic amino acid/polyamine antiporter
MPTRDIIDRIIHLKIRGKMKTLFIRKSLKQIFSETSGIAASDGSHPVQLKKTLGSFHLMMIGVGAIIGAGIFSLIGTTAAYYSGPAIVFSFLIAGVISALAGLCYAEMAAMIPISGSAYTYAYATLGELVAWIIGWDLVLEYALGGVVIAASWSGYFCSLLTKTLGITFSDPVLRLTKGPWEFVTLSTGESVRGFWNLPASLITLLLAVTIYKSLQKSALINNLMVVVKIAIILAFIILGWPVIDPAHWIADPSAIGLAQLVPPQGMVMKNGHEFLSLGWPGVVTGAGIVFFAYIGFDMISTMSQECKNPGRNLPIGIIGSLIICTILYIVVSLVMTGILPFQQLGVADPIAVGIDHIISNRGWPIEIQKGITFIIKMGALAGLTSGLLVVMIGQSRIFYAMGRDGLLPWFGRLHPQYATPHVSTIMTAIMVSICAGLMPIGLVGELVSIGTLLAFVIVFIGVAILRVKLPDAPRPFRTPIYWFVAPAGAFICVWVMCGLPSDTWWRLVTWLAFGFLIYFGYGVRNSKARIQ